MSNDLIIDNVRFASAPEEQHEKGLLGWISFTINGAIHLSGVTLRRTLGGELTLSFPSRRDAYGREHFFTKPVTDEVRRSLERQIFRALALAVEEDS